MIKIGRQVIRLDGSIQIGTTNEPFFYAGCRSRLDVPQKWVGKDFKHHFIHTFRYVENRTKGFEIETDYNEDYVKDSYVKC